MNIETRINLPESVEGDSLTLGYGGVSEITPELAEVMRQNSESLNQILTSKVACLDYSVPTVD